jgi:hypothetical protein
MTNFHFVAVLVIIVIAQVTGILYGMSLCSC